MKKLVFSWGNILASVFIIIFLLAFTIQALKYRFTEEDYYITAVTTEKGFTKAVSFLYTEQNGQLGSHLLSSVLFLTGSKWEGVFIIWQYILVFLLLISTSFFVRSLVNRIGLKSFSSLQYYFFSLTFIAITYLSSNSLNRDIWHWTAANCVHLFSFIVIIYSAGYLLKHQHSFLLKHALYSFLLLLFAGSFSEVDLLTTLFILIPVGIYQHLTNRSFYPVLIAAILGSTTALLINICSPGSHIRLDLLLDFNMIQTSKNVLHTYWGIFRNTYIEALLLIPILYSIGKKYRTSKLVIPLSTRFILITSFLACSLINVFISCYLHADLAPVSSYMFPIYLLFGAIILFSADTSRE